jgi:predicted secreted protein
MAVDGSAEAGVDIGTDESAVTAGVDKEGAPEALRSGLEFKFEAVAGDGAGTCAGAGAGSASF